MTIQYGAEKTLFACKITNASIKTLVIFNTYCCYQQYEIFLSSTRVQIEIIVALTWQHRTLFIVDNYIYTNNDKKGAYCFVFMVKIVSQTHHNITLTYVVCLVLNNVFSHIFLSYQYIRAYTRSACLNVRIMVKVSIIVVNCNSEWNTLRNFRLNPQYLISLIRTLMAEANLHYL
jgi:hypothetical protein